MTGRRGAQVADERFARAREEEDAGLRRPADAAPFFLGLDAGLRPRGAEVRVAAMAWTTTFDAPGRVPAVRRRRAAAPRRRRRPAAARRSSPVRRRSPSRRGRR